MTQKAKSDLFDSYYLCGLFAQDKSDKCEV